MILVDTSVWVDHLRGQEPRLVEHLKTNQVLMHSLVMGELACGNLTRRVERFRDWHALPSIPELRSADVIALIEARRLMGRGIGFVDAHLLGAALNHAGTFLWTRDKRLLGIAQVNGVAFSE